MGISRKRRLSRLQHRTREDIQRKSERDQSIVVRKTGKLFELNGWEMRIQIRNILQLSARQKQPTGWVYLVPTQRLIENRRYCKIGFSADVDERCKSLCTNNPHALDLTALRAIRGTIMLETMLKTMTAAFTTDGANEWRAFPDEVYQLIANMLPLFPWSERPEKKQRLERLETRSSSSAAKEFDLPEFAQSNVPIVVPFAEALVTPPMWSTLSADDSVNVRVPISTLYQVFKKWASTREDFPTPLPSQASFILMFNEILRTKTTAAAVQLSHPDIQNRIHHIKL